MYGINAFMSFESDDGSISMKKKLKNKIKKELAKADNKKDEPPNGEESSD